MKIAIVGAGPSGLATAAVLQEFGHDVLVFEQSPDIGGVWSATRTYPGVSTQDDRVTYAFSDVPMPQDYQEHPTGAQVRAYLEHYAEVKGVRSRVHLDTRVESAEPSGDGWRVTTSGAEGATTHEVDWLVVANGAFSTPHVPDWPGRDEFEAAGGHVRVPSRLGGDTFEGRDVVVVGWGKTACDVAVEISRAASSTTVVARALHWKIPKRIAGALTFRHLQLTRLGEHVLTAPRTSLASFVVAAAGLPARRALLWALRRTVARRTGLRAIDLVPSSRVFDGSLVSDGFFQAVADGHLQVRRERTIQALGVAEGQPGVRLSDGSWLPADVVVAATGFDQDVSFFPTAVQTSLTGTDGALALHRRVLPLDVQRLAFVGWWHTYRSPLTAEIAAVWLAGHLACALPTRTPDERRRLADRYHLTHRQAAAHGEPQLPSGSFAALDGLLEDLGLPLPASVRRRQWLTPLDPSAYAYLAPALRHRLGLDGPGAVPTPHQVVPAHST